MRKFPHAIVRWGRLIAFVFGAGVLAAAASDAVIAGGSAPVAKSLFFFLDSAPTAPLPFGAPIFGPQPQPQPEVRAPRRFATRPVCVRLCDGAFFPIDSTSSGVAKNAATCAGLCPDAPTALYFERAGSDRIEDAVSTKGAPYTALPTALRYRTTLDAACACRRAPTRRFPIMRDSTLRKGDYVMTANGLVEFTGSGRLPHASSDFTPLAVARVPQDKRAALVAMERASPSTAVR